MIMNSPKLLPWFARKAGINEELARKLWRRACGEAELIQGSTKGSDYHAMCLSRFLAHLDTESLTADPLDSQSAYGWFWRHQGRLAQYNLATARSTFRIYQDLWQKLTLPACTH